MKQFFFLLVLGLSLVACQQNPQNKAASEAEKHGEMADKEAQEARDLMEQSNDKANAALTDATRSEFSAALSKVDVPSFDNNMRANELVKKIGNTAVEYVNSKDEKAAEKFAGQIKADLEQVDKLEADGKLTTEVASSIRQYAENLANSVQVNVYEVQVVQ